MTYQLFQLPRQTNLSAVLTLVPGAKALFELAETSTPAVTYQDPERTVPHANPVVADAAGVFPPIYLDPEIEYRVTLKTSANVTLPGYPLDYINDQLLSQGIIGTLLYPRSQAEIDALVTPVNIAQPWGAIQRYGNNTVPGTTDMSTALQNALKCNPRVWDNNTGRSVFAIGQTLYLTCDAQIFQGNGRGNVNEPGRTVLKWIGASGGTMLSVSDGVDNFQNCSVLDIELDGNALANVGIEGYDDAIAGGCWRNKYRVSIRGVTQGANSCGIYLGNGTFPDFAHDTEIHSSYITDPDRGVWGAGAKTKLIATTIRGCTDCGIRAEPGSSFSDYGGVFSQNNRDFDGDTITSADFTGTWFEDSTLGIYRAATAHTASFVGCNLHTQSATALMDMGNAAGNWVIKGSRITDGSASTLIENINDTYEYEVSTSGATTETGYRIRTQGVTRGLQCAFAAGITADDDDATGDGTTRHLNAVAWTEVFDRSSSFNAATGTFTAPVDGEYHFDIRVNMHDLADTHTDGRVYLLVNGVQHLLCRYNIGAIRDAANEVVIGGSDTVFLSAGQTVYPQVYVNGGAKVVDIGSGADGNLWRTRFQGRML